jgi:mono/diheme cytochrome c family protein
MRTQGRLFVLAALSTAAHAEIPADFLAAYARQAKQENPAYQAPSAQQGQRFFAALHGGEWSCASCHTNNPAATGKHAVTGKLIEPPARIA